MNAYSNYQKYFTEWLEGHELQLHEVDAETIVQFLDEKKPRGEYWSGRTKCLANAAIRAMAREAGLPKLHPAFSLKVKRGKSGIQRAVDEDTYMALQAAVDTSTIAGKRDAAMMALAFDTGLASNEICNVQLSEVNLQRRQVSMMRQKTGVEVTPIFSEPTRAKLEAWLSVRGQVVRGHDRLFCAIGGLTPGGPLTNGGLRSIERNWGARLGMKLSPHDWRRGCAGQMHLRGVPDALGMLQGGWDSYQVYHGYTRHLMRAGMIDQYLPTRCELEESEAERVRVQVPK